MAIIWFIILTYLFLLYMYLISFYLVYTPSGMQVCLLKTFLSCLPHVL